MADAQSFKQWQTAFSSHVSDLATLGSDIHYTSSAERLRGLLRAGVLQLRDLGARPERFFEAHRLLSQYATDLGPGFGIRFTVQFNLFAGTILALGTPEQVALLDTYQREGTLGCFALTEKLAGVSSGLVVNTTATWSEEKGAYVVHCPDRAAQKNWISQGCTADKCVVLATLVVGGRSHGPHAFLMDLRRSSGELVPGVTTGDMGAKTIGNDLDNAWISFEHVELPPSALLSRYADVVHGQYVQKVKGIKMFDQIGQRLYTGRVVIAASTLCFARSLFQKTQQYADGKECWGPKGRNTKLSAIPQLASLFAEGERRLGRLEGLIAHIEEQLCACLLGDAHPTPALVDLVAAAKVRCIETTIDLCFRLKQEVGSYALMGGTGFDKLDYLQCCKFAEGDSRILMQKMARDRFATFAMAKPGAPADAREAALCAQLAGTLAKAPRKFQAWNDAWETVYELADVTIDNLIDGAVGTEARPRL